jgi:hypothetical protein
MTIGRINKRKWKWMPKSGGKEAMARILIEVITVHKIFTLRKVDHFLKVY